MDVLICYTRSGDTIRCRREVLRRLLVEGDAVKTQSSMGKAHGSYRAEFDGWHSRKPAQRVSPAQAVRFYRMAFAGRVNAGPTLTRRASNTTNIYSRAHNWIRGV